MPAKIFQKKNGGYRDEKNEEAKVLILHVPPLLPGDDDTCEELPAFEALKDGLVPLAFATSGSGTGGDGNNNNS